MTNSIRTKYGFFYLIAISLLFLAPELLIWRSVDQYQTPLRYYRGDTAHYVTILSKALVNGGPTGNVYLEEDSRVPSRFPLFQSLAGLLSFVSPEKIAWIVILLHLFVALSVFGLFAALMVLLGVPRAPARLVSFLFVASYGPIAFQGYGLANWFLPALLLGLYAILWVHLREEFATKSGVLLIASLALFSLHPAYFGFGVVATSFLWLARFYSMWPRVSRTVWVSCVLWGATAIAIFFFVFFPSLRASPLSHDLLVRMALISTRVLIHPLISLRLLILVIVSILGFRSTNDPLARWRWYGLGILTLSGLLLLNSYLVTGSYLVNDHYVIAEEILAILTALVLLYGPEIKTRSPRTTRFLGIATILITLFSIFDVLNYLHFRLGFYGRWAAAHGAYLLLGSLLLFPEVRNNIQRLMTRKLFAVCASVLVLTYATALTYKDTTNAHLPRHREVQAYRPLVEALNRIPYGVVLADTSISNLVALYTPHFVYWSPYAFSEPVRNDDLFVRWQNARLFFPEDAGLAKGASTPSLLGAIDRCYDGARIDWLNALARLGFPGPRAAICAVNDAREAAYPELETRAHLYASSTNSVKEWDPTYKVTYLVLEAKNNHVPSWLLATYFREIEQTVEMFRIYEHVVK